MYWTNPDKPDKMATTGLELVRRDNCRLVRKTQETVLRKILDEECVEAGVDHFRQVLQNLKRGKVDMGDLIITKQLAASYANKQIHAILQEKMLKRDAGSAPRVGDRVPYVVVAGHRKSKTSERGEDPMYALVNDIPIDADYYVENQLFKPMDRVLGPLVPNFKSLVNDAMRTSVQTISRHGIGAHFQKAAQCLACGHVMRGKGAVCPNCAPEAPRIVVEVERELQEAQASFQQLWTQCQRCQGSMTEEILCENTECDIFYRRVKAKKDRVKAEDKFNRLRDIEDLVMPPSKTTTPCTHVSAAPARPAIMGPPKTEPKPPVKKATQQKWNWHA